MPRSRVVRAGVAAMVAAALLLPLVATPISAVSVTGIDLQLPAGASVSGRVVDVDDQGVPGASVGVCRGPFDCFTVDAIADADGTFSINGVEPGEYLVGAFPSGEIPSNVLPAYFAEGGSVTDPEQATVVTVGAGGVSGIAITMPRGIILSGRTLDANGDPVPGVTVAANGDQMGGVSQPSDATGAWQVVGLGPNSGYRLEVFTEGLPFPRGAVGSGYVTTPDDDGTMVPVFESDVAGIDITMTRGNRISGQLDGAVGEAIDVLALGELDGGTWHVDVAGAFAIEGVWPGTYGLTFVHREADPDDGTFPYGVYDGQDRVLASQFEPGVQVDASGGDVTGLTAIVPDLPRLSGRVTSASGGLGSARVFICDPDNGCAFITTPADGTFEAVNLPPGDYTVQAGAGGHVPAYYRTGGVTTDPDEATRIHVTTTDVAGIGLQLSLGSSIAGRITGPNGEPVVGAFVSPRPSSGGISELGPGAGITDANGEYVIRGLVDDTYTLRINPPLYSVYQAGYWSAAGWTDDFTQADEIVITSAPTITGRTPAPGATSVARSVSVTMTLSVAVTGVSKQTFQVREGTRLIPGTVTYAASTHVATFKPAAPLKKRTTYTVSVLPGIRDAAGNPLAATSWTFTTAP